MRPDSGQSLIHHLHPLVKLGWLVWVTVAVFAFDAVALPLIVAATAATLLWVSGVAPWRVPGIRLCITVGTTILVIHILVSSQGDRLIGPVTTGGLVLGLRAAGRLLSVILVSSLFVMTTEPVSLACAMMRFGLPYRWGFALVTALRLAPVFRLEAHHVYQAQLVRGVAYDAVGPRRWWLLLRHLCFPLLVSAMRTAHSLSLSMEGRAFGLCKERTYLREVPTSRYDVLLGVLLAASIVLGVWWRCVGVATS